MVAKLPSAGPPISRPVDFHTRGLAFNSGQSLVSGGLLLPKDAIHARPADP